MGYVVLLFRASSMRAVPSRLMLTIQLQAFGSIGKERTEVIVQGTHDDIHGME